ncbi:MAG: nucleotide pyrophosphohydrolase [Bacillota bacterium]
MSRCRICLPRLNNLSPTLESTVLKLMEEAGELARAVLKHMAGDGRTDLLTDVARELLDVAQTCISMVFVLEESHQIMVETLTGEHLAKLAAKGYRYPPGPAYGLHTAPGGGKCLNLPRLQLEDVDLLKTVCKIQEEIGELTEYLGKGAALSGERKSLDRAGVMRGCALELLDIAQCCFTMMYILTDRHGVDMQDMLRQHNAKLKARGYCK